MVNMPSLCIVSVVRPVHTSPEMGAVKAVATSGREGALGGVAALAGENSAGLCRKAGFDSAGNVTRLRGGPLLGGRSLVCLPCVLLTSAQITLQAWQVQFIGMETSKAQNGASGRCWK